MESMATDANPNKRHRTAGVPPADAAAAYSTVLTTPSNNQAPIDNAPKTTGGVQKISGIHLGLLTLRYPDGGQDISSFSYSTEMLPLDPKFLLNYNMPLLQAEWLCNILQTQFTYGNGHIRDALLSMVYAMVNKMSEIDTLTETNSTIQIELHTVQTRCSELQEAKDGLELEIRSIPGLQVMKHCHKSNLKLSDIFPADQADRGAE